MITRSDHLIRLSGDVTINTVNTLYKEGLLSSQENQIGGEYQVDFSGLGKVDSSAVSLMLTWIRQAQNKGIRLQFIGVPENLKSLARLYGVAELINYN